MVHTGALLLALVLIIAGGILRGEKPIVAVLVFTMAFGLCLPP